MGSGVAELLGEAATGFEDHHQKFVAVLCQQLGILAVMYQIHIFLRIVDPVSQFKFAVFILGELILPIQRGSLLWRGESSDPHRFPRL